MRMLRKQIWFSIEQYCCSILFLLLALVHLDCGSGILGHSSQGCGFLPVVDLGFALGKLLPLRLGRVRFRSVS